MNKTQRRRIEAEIQNRENWKENYKEYVGRDYIGSVRFRMRSKSIRELEQWLK